MKPVAYAAITYSVVSTAVVADRDNFEPEIWLSIHQRIAFTGPNPPFRAIVVFGWSKGHYLFRGKEKSFFPQENDGEGCSALRDLLGDRLLDGVRPRI